MTELKFYMGKETGAQSILNGWARLQTNNLGSDPAYPDGVWFPIFDNQQMSTAWQTDYATVIPLNGAFSRLFVQLGDIQGAGGTFDLTLWKNGEPTELTVSFAPGDAQWLIKSDLTHVVTIAEGDLIMLKASNHETAPNNHLNTWAMVFTATP